MHNIDSILENSRGLDVIKEITENKEIYLKKMISYVSQDPNPLLLNERQCYLYPLRATQLIIIEDINRLLFEKKGNRWPYLEQIFAYFHQKTLNPTVIGYIERILRKSVALGPDIFDFLKQNLKSREELCEQIVQQGVSNILSVLLLKNSNSFYLFLKKDLVRKIIEECLTRDDFEYLQGVLNILQQLCTQIELKKSQQLIEIAELFTSEEFFNIIILKIDQTDRKITWVCLQIIWNIITINYACFGFLEQSLKEAINNKLSLLEEIFEAFEETEEFGVRLGRHILTLIQIFSFLIENEVIPDEAIVIQNCKRILLYSSIFHSHSILHNILFKLICYLVDHEDHTYILFQRLSLLKFLYNTYTQDNNTFKITCRRIFRLLDNHYDSLHQFLQEAEEWKLVKQIIKDLNQKDLSYIRYQIHSFKIKKNSSYEDDKIPDSTDTSL